MRACSSAPATSVLGAVGPITEAEGTSPPAVVRVLQPERTSAAATAQPAPASQMRASVALLPARAILIAQDLDCGGILQPDRRTAALLDDTPYPHAATGKLVDRHARCSQPLLDSDRNHDREVATPVAPEIQENHTRPVTDRDHPTFDQFI